MGEFIQVIKDGATYGGDLRKVVEMIIDKAGLIRALQDEGTDEARGRIENIQEFLGVVDEFVQTHDAEESDFAAPTVGEDESAEPVRVLRGDSLADFIEWVRLRTDLDTVTEDGQAVTLMTCLLYTSGRRFVWLRQGGLRGLRLANCPEIAAD